MTAVYRFFIWPVIDFITAMSILKLLYSLYDRLQEANKNEEILQKAFKRPQRDDDVDTLMVKNLLEFSSEPQQKSTEKIERKLDNTGL